jgi:multisubunit Na+/H+ antiporter MnhG subunit
MAEPGSEYHHGDMDIHQQAATYSLVMSASKWSSLYLAAMLLALVLWFCVGSGFLGGLIAALVVIALGTLVLRKGSGGH